MVVSPRNHRTPDRGLVSRARIGGVGGGVHDNAAGDPHKDRHPSLHPPKLDRYINDIRVRSFILTGAPAISTAYAERAVLKRKLERRLER